jgi:Zn finger protein HypA/HybF involved in hydrogenase expression
MSSHPIRVSNKKEEWGTCKHCGEFFIKRNAKHKICGDPQCQQHRKNRVTHPSTPYKLNEGQHNIKSGDDRYFQCPQCKVWRNKENINKVCPICEGNNNFDKSNMAHPHPYKMTNPRK